MKFQIMSTFWGTQHLEWFKRGCLKSLAFAKNYQTITEHCSRWNIFTDPEKMDYVKELMAITFPKVQINVQSTDDLRTYTDHLQSALVYQVEECLKAKERFLFAPPDTIFSNGTIHNLMTFGRQNGTCVAVAHPRVHPEILEDLSEESPKLVAKFMNYQHQSFSDAEVGHKRQNSFIGGIRWERLDDKTISVTHHLPTVYFADFTPEDLMYFKTQTSFGCYDHLWPADVLLKHQRQRYVGSSDGAFIVELTERWKNIPPVKPGSTDQFWVSHSHNLQNRMTNVIFRAEYEHENSWPEKAP